jgi:hypothetical protein
MVNFVNPYFGWPLEYGEVALSFISLESSENVPADDCHFDCLYGQLGLICDGDVSLFIMAFQLFFSHSFH